MYQWSVYGLGYSIDRLNAWASHPLLEMQERKEEEGKKVSSVGQNADDGCGSNRDSGFPRQQEHLFPRIQGRLNWAIVMSFYLELPLSLSSEPPLLVHPKCHFVMHKSIVVYHFWQDMLLLVTSTRSFTDIPGFFSRWTAPIIISIIHSCLGDDLFMPPVIWMLLSLFSWQILVKVSLNVKWFNGRCLESYNEYYAWNI